MNKAEQVFNKIAFPKTIRNIANLSKQKKYIMEPLKQTIIGRTPAAKKALKKAQKALQNLDKKI